MFPADPTAAGTTLAAWYILGAYLGICLIPLAPAIRRAWRIVALTWAFWRDRALAYDLRRALHAARQHA